MNRYKVINTHLEKHNNIVLHEDILDILFKYKIEVHRKLIDLRGAFLIDHIAIKIIDPDNKMVILSLTPSVEYNLIVQGLWKYDKSFCPNFKNLNSLYLWEDAYSEEHFAEIKNIKELKHGFTFGFNLAKKLILSILFILMPLEAKIRVYKNIISSIFKNFLLWEILATDLYVIYTQNFATLNIHRLLLLIKKLIQRNLF